MPAPVAPTTEPRAPRTSSPLPAGAPPELPCWQADALAADARPERSFNVRFADGQRLPAAGSSFVCRGLEPDPFPPCRVVAVHPEGYVEAACPGAP